MTSNSETSNSETSNSETVQPVLCTLIEKDKHSQLLEWSDVAPLTTKSKRIENGVVLEFEPSMAEKIVDLAQRESGCCGTWLSIATSVSKETVRLEATTESEDGLEILHTMLGIEKW